MVEQITHAGQLLAIVVRASYRAEGIVFFTPGDFSQQLGYMHRPKGHVIPPHVHNEVVREVTLTNEVLLVRSGRVRVDFYDGERHYLESRVLAAGDVILLARGGHGFEMLEPSELVEVKQGPYSGDADKTRFDPGRPGKLRIVGG
jgi:mannose-6-phosphate isomerase-like protein (cupin superfamily)